MLIETLALTALAASAFSSAAHQSVATKMALGQWRDLMDEVGPERYIKLLQRMPSGRTLDQASWLLGDVYRLMISDFDGYSSGPIQYAVVEGNEEIQVGPATEGGERGATVFVWFVVKTKDLKGPDFHEGDDSLEDAYSRALKHALRDDPRVIVRFGEVLISERDSAVIDVRGWIWISETELLQWLQKYRG